MIGTIVLRVDEAETSQLQRSRCYYDSAVSAISSCSLNFSGGEANVLQHTIIDYMCYLLFRRWKWTPMCGTQLDPIPLLSRPRQILCCEMYNPRLFRTIIQKCCTYETTLQIPTLLCNVTG